MAKRLFDFTIAMAGLILAIPAIIIIALAIKVDSPGPVFFRQKRVGRYGKIFLIHKFRTMVEADTDHGPLITAGNDARITRIGRILRKYKFDEIPQLIDVILGNMSLVGPRPEIPQYVSYYPEEQKSIVQTIRPGITDAASIEFRNENEILGQSKDPHKTYIEVILPIKLQYYMEYVKKRSLIGDICIIVKTLTVIGR